MQLPILGRSSLIGLFVILFAFYLAQSSGSAATLTWTGLAGDGNVATAGNWSPAATPVTGDTLIFAGTNSLAPQRTTNLSLAAISFSSGASSFTLGGAGEYTISTAAGITNNSVSLQTINNDIKLGLDQTWTASSGAMTFGGAVNLNNSVLTIDGSFNTTISGQISSGGGSLTKNGTGTLTLSGSTGNNYGGTTTVNDGTLVLAKTGGNAIPGAFVIGDGVGTDTVLLMGANQINNKNVTINSSGLLDLNSNSDAIGTLTMTGGRVDTETGTFTLGGNVTTNAFTASAIISGNFSLGGADRTFTVADGTVADDLLISANINSSGRKLTKDGAGRMVLSGSNLLKDVAISAGTLTLRNSNALGTGATPVVSSGATMELEGGITINNALTLNGTGVGGQGALLNVSGSNTYSANINQGSSSTIGSNSGTLTITGNMDGSGGGKSFTFIGAGNTTVTGIISDNGSVTKNGAGTLTLTGANTFTGTTVVSSGTLIAAGTSGGALNTTSAVTVNSGGTLLLGANDQIKNTAGVTLAGGTFATGGFSEGTAAAAGMGALTLTAPGSVINFGIGTGSVLSFASFSAGSNNLTIDNWTGTPWTVGNASTDRLIFNSDQAANLSFFSFTGYTGATEINLGGGFWEVVPVPEPPTWAAGVLAVAVLGYAVRKRRAKAGSISALGRQNLLRYVGSNYFTRRTLLVSAAFTSISGGSLVFAAPADEITQAVSVRGVSNASTALPKQFATAFTAVAFRVEPSELPDYVVAAVKLRPDLAPISVAIAVKAACANSGATRTGRVELCQLVHQIVKVAVAANPAAAARIARAAVVVCREMRQCIIEGAIAGAPGAENNITEAVLEVSLPPNDSMFRSPNDVSIAPVVSPEQPPPL